MICLSVFAEEYAKAASACERFGRRLPVVELRLDTADRRTVERAVGSVGRPLILTCRAASQGGLFKGGEAERIQVLREAIRFRPLYIDVEFGTAAEELIEENPEQPFILSHHAPGGAKDMDTVLRAMLSTRAAMLKVVLGVEKWVDNLRVAEVAVALAKTGRSFTCFGMGERGLFSRVDASRRGAALAYCRADGAKATAPGQCALSDALELYRLDKVGGDWRVFGVAGNPVSHSLSPLVHNTLFEQYGMEAVYLPFRIDSFQDFHRFAGEAGISGLSITSPHKTAAAGCADAGDDIVRLAYAANTLLRNSESAAVGFTAFNTDGPAFVDFLSDKLGGVRDRSVTVFGAGGAGRAIALSLIKSGARVFLRSRTEAAGRELALSWGAEGQAEPIETVENDAAVNATTLTGEDADSEKHLFPYIPVGRMAVDLHYHPPQTAFLHRALLRGCLVFNGLEFFARQAAKQLRIWTSREPDWREVLKIVCRGSRGDEKPIEENHATEQLPD